MTYSYVVGVMVSTIFVSDLLMATLFRDFAKLMRTGGSLQMKGS